MKKLLLTLALVLLFAAPVSAWNLFFVAQQEVVGQSEGEDVYGYKLGPDDKIVIPSQVTVIQQVGANYCFVYITNNNALALEVKDWPEFRGFGYTDFIWRIALGLSSGNLAEAKYMSGAHWYVGGEWHFGTIKQWEDAGSPPIVYFSRLRDFFGIDMQ